MFTRVKGSYKDRRVFLKKAWFIWFLIFAAFSFPDANFAADRIQPGNFQYLGAFRLPDSGVRPHTFEYGGNAMTFNPEGDPGGGVDGHPGSLFVTGHDRLPYGELPDGNQLAEISIPTPVVSSRIDDLPVAQFIQTFHNTFAGLFEGLDEIPRVGIEYLNHPATGPKIHVAWGQHFQESPTPSHVWIEPNVTTPDPQGPWYIGYQSMYSVNGYLFEIPESWATVHANGRVLATGRYRDGGWSGMGPALFAYRPWIDDAGTPAAPGTHLQETVLLLYENSQNTSNIERAMRDYQHADEWEGGAWITTTSGRTAVLFAGTKGVGAKYWYGWVNPRGPEYPCVETAFVGEFPVCRNADGSECPPEDLLGCDGHNDFRGWWSSEFRAQFILYDPDDLAQVAEGTMEPWEPQPYATVDIDDHLFHNPTNVETDMLGTGPQRRFRIGAVAYDRNNGFLYVLELFAEGAKPVVHVWHIEDGDTETNLSAYLERVQSFYIAYYQRPADPAGLIWWAGELARMGGNVDIIIEAFANSPESRRLYGEITGDTIGSVVDGVYRALFNRDPDPAGKNFYVEEFISGRVTAATIMINILDGAVGSDRTIIDNKVAAAMNFTRVIDPELDGRDYLVTYTSADEERARSYLTSVTEDSSTIYDLEEARAYIIEHGIADPGDNVFDLH